MWHARLLKSLKPLEIAMTPKELITKVQRTADTKGQEIGASDVSRVISQTFLILGSLSPAEQHELIAKLFKSAEKIKAKKKAAKKNQKKFKPEGQGLIVVPNA